HTQPLPATRVHLGYCLSQSRLVRGKVPGQAMPFRTRNRAPGLHEPVAGSATPHPVGFGISAIIAMPNEEEVLTHASRSALRGTRKKVPLPGPVFCYPWLESERVTAVSRLIPSDFKCLRLLVSHLLLLRRDHHDHLPAFKARARFDHDVLAEVTLDPGGHLPAQLLVAHLAATEADVHLDLVAFLQEAAHVAQLDLVVALVGHRAELHFLDLDLAGLLLGLVGLLLHFELELAEVHDLADRRIRVR